MIISTNKEPTLVEFEKLCRKSCDILNQKAKSDPDYFLSKGAQKLEPEVKEAMEQAAKGTGFENTIKIISGQRFPDIVAAKLYGVEVKSTKDDGWKVIGGSVAEGTRVEGVEHIFFMFGKLHKPVSFKTRRYEECLSDIAVTHSPRYKIDMDLPDGETIFDKMGVSYDEMRKMDNPIKPVVEYYRKTLKPGESLWWVNGEDATAGSAPAKIRMWKTLSKEERDELIAQGFALFPELFSDNRKVKLYQEAVSFCVALFENEWSNIEPFPTLFRNNFAEHLIHNTKDNVAKYPDFDTRFYKMPSYMRRDIISTVIGHLSSYHSHLKKWYDNGCKGKKPTLQKNLRKFPTFYKSNMYTDAEIDNDTVKMKLFVDNDWKFVSVKLKHTDMQYLRKYYSGKKISNPTLEKKYNKWFLRFAVTEETKLHKKPISEQRILAIDLGLNTDATCSVMLSDGTILARKFINFASDKDRIWHCLNKVKGIQQKYGSKGTNTKKLWRYAKSLNDELASKIANAIVEYVLEMQVDTIVFEHLDTNGKKKGSKKQHLTMWKKNSIQRIVEHKAHRHKIRMSRICAWGTSKYAFDGSGIVVRGKTAHLSTYELCKFSSGKIYNCDLSASYNIGARYFIREIQKSTSVKKWSRIVAKVPECEKRTLCTYSTLLRLNKVA